jgi:hypothetical protein
MMPVLSANGRLERQGNVFKAGRLAVFHKGSFMTQGFSSGTVLLGYFFCLIINIRKLALLATFAICSACGALTL